MLVYGMLFEPYFFKYTSGQLLLEEHWISLKMAPISFSVNVSNASYQNEFSLLNFRWGTNELPEGYLLFNLYIRNLFYEINNLEYPSSSGDTTPYTCLPDVISTLAKFWKASNKHLPYRGEKTRGKVTNFRTLVPKFPPD